MHPAGNIHPPGLVDKPSQSALDFGKFLLPCMSDEIVPVYLCCERIYQTVMRKASFDHMDDF